MKDKRFPDGKCEGRDLRDRGVTAGVTDTYGAEKTDLGKGYTGGTSIRKEPEATSSQTSYRRRSDGKKTYS